jgi:pyridoxamine 5'-phosphate oxidase
MLAGYSFTLPIAITVYFQMSHAQDQPAHYNDLTAVETTIEILLSQAVRDAGHAMRKPFLATLGVNGRPKTRIVILRSLDWGARSLRFHTDVRSAKVAEISTCPDVSLAFYDPGQEIQVQLSAVAQAHTNDEFAEKAWASATDASLRAYLGDALSGAPSQTPISGLPKDVEGIIPPHDRIVEGRKNFAAIEVRFHQIDWLFLSSAGNRRARFEIDGNEWAGTWLVP